MALELKDLKRQVDEAVKHQRDYELSFTILETKLKSKMNLLSELEKAIDDTRKLKDSLDAEFQQKNQELMRTLEDRKRATAEREQKLVDAEMELRRIRNFADENAGKLVQKMKELDATKAEFRAKITKIVEFVQAAAILRQDLGA